MNPWFRFYSRFMTDPDVEELSFEDQRHFVFVLCMKSEGLLDHEFGDPLKRERAIARRLGLQGEALTFAKQRLVESGLINEHWQPRSWDKLQFKSDQDLSRAARQKRYRERKKSVDNQKLKESNARVTRYVSVTAPVTCPSSNARVTPLEQNRTEQNITTTPTPPPKTDPEEDPEPSGRCGGENIKNSKDVTQENPFGEEKPAGPPALVWPVQFGESEKRAAEKTLKPFAPDQAQDLLDELAAQLMIKAINKPLAYLRTLAKKAKAGEFELEAGIPFRDSREARRKRDEAIARRDREEKVRIAQPQEPKAAPPSKPGMKVISERISDMRQALTGRRF